MYIVDHDVYEGDSYNVTPLRIYASKEETFEDEEYKPKVFVEDGEEWENDDDRIIMHEEERETKRSSGGERTYIHQTFVDRYGNTELHSVDAYLGSHDWLKIISLYKEYSKRNKNAN
jgi:hypothetical protein